MGRKKFSLIGEITDFDYHGTWGDFNSPKPLKAFLDTLAPGEEAEIEINSPGGLVIQGVEMANAIKNSKAKIVAHVTGIAASMASVIACACHKIEMEEASFMMIHDPWGYALGNAEEMRKEASLLDQMKAVIMSFYRGKFKGLTEEQISALMGDETWYTGNECKENGLDCEVIKSDVRAAASIVGHKFAKIPEAAAKYLNAPELTDEGRAEIEAAKTRRKKVPRITKTRRATGNLAIGARRGKSTSFRRVSQSLKSARPTGRWKRSITARSLKSATDLKLRSRPSNRRAQTRQRRSKIWRIRSSNRVMRISRL